MLPPETIVIKFWKLKGKWIIMSQKNYHLENKVFNYLIKHWQR